MPMAVALPRPNQRMNTGTQASDGIGISALASGRKKPSIGRKRPIRMPSGRATTTASANADQHPIERAGGVRRQAAVQHAIDQRARHARQRRQQRGGK